MNTKVEKLLTDMIAYFDYRVTVESVNYVKNIENKIGREITFFRVGDLPPTKRSLKLRFYIQ